VQRRAARHRRPFGATALYVAVAVVPRHLRWEAPAATQVRRGVRACLQRKGSTCCLVLTWASASAPASAVLRLQRCGATIRCAVGARVLRCHRCPQRQLPAPRFHLGVRASRRASSIWWLHAQVGGHASAWMSARLRQLSHGDSTLCAVAAPPRLSRPLHRAVLRPLLQGWAAHARASAAWLHRPSGRPTRCVAVAPPRRRERRRHPHRPL